MNCCTVPYEAAPRQNVLAAIAAFLTAAPTAPTRTPRDLEAAASAAHRRALDRADGTWGGYQAALPAFSSRRRG